MTESPRTVIAIDGPAASGKSSTAQWVAERLAFRHVDSGSLYRAVGLLTLREGGAASDHAERLHIELGDRVLLDEEDVTEALRTPEVSEAAARVATNQRVREALSQTQGNVTRSARLLGISRRSLQSKMKELGLRGGESDGPTRT